MSISFDGVTLDNPVITLEDVGPYHRRMTFRSRTATKANALALAAKWGGTVNKRILIEGKVSLTGPGTKGSLVVDADTYTNCIITAFQITPVNPAETHYDYTATIERDTSGA